MVKSQQNCKIPDVLVPHCPICFADMEVNIRKDMYFVQDKAWYDAAYKYEKFLSENKNSNIVFLELGVGYNTPTIIRFPFERYTHIFNNATLIRINLGKLEIPQKIKNKSISICNNIENVLPFLLD